MKLCKFTDANEICYNLDKNYIKHKTGYVVLAPPGSGKTTYIDNQVGKKSWIDSDILFNEENINMEFMNSTNSTIRRQAYMLELGKMNGYRILGASVGALYMEHKADAVVILPLKQHYIYFYKRKDLDLTKIFRLREMFYKHAKKNNIPIFDSIKDAITYLELKVI